MSNVQVVVRARPPSRREVDMGSPIVLKMVDKCTTLTKTREGIAVGETKDDSKQFQYDFSYWSVDPSDSHFASQEQVFEDLGKIVLEAAFEGYNVCVFAYGQTGSGKTYSMMGLEDAPGLIPRICEALYDHVAAGNLRNVSYRTEASYMEIYNESVRDLLHKNSHKTTHSLRVREHPKDGPYVEKLSKHSVSDYESIQKLMKLGNSQRATASTKMNDVSSRSHAIFTLIFTQATYSGDLPCETVSKINLVDLAGSERASATGAKGIRLKEGGNINKSLTSLGNVISALADLSSHDTHHKKPFIPYRDSVLTWLLKDSLGGNSKTIMIATVSPSECCYAETLSTLRYANRAKSIVNTPVVNEDPNVRLIRELRSEIKRLKAIISSEKFDSDKVRGRANSLQLAADIYRKEEQIAKLTMNWAEKWEDIQQILEDRNLALRSDGVKMTVASEQPYILALDDDSFKSGITLYHLKDGDTTIGSEAGNPPPDIVLFSSDIATDHCVLNFSEERVFIQPNQGKCCVNAEEITSQRTLSHGDMIMLGDFTLFRFNYLAKAKQTKSRVELWGTSSEIIIMFCHTDQWWSAPNTSDKSYNYERRDRAFPCFTCQPGQNPNLSAEISSPVASFYGTKKWQALERDYEERLKTAREEFERKKEMETAELRLEVQRLKQSAAASENSSRSDTPTTSFEENGVQSSYLSTDPSYNLMRSIAFEPISSKSLGTLEAVKGPASIQSSMVSRDESLSPDGIKDDSSFPVAAVFASSPSALSVSQHSSESKNDDEMYLVIEPEVIPKLLESSISSNNRIDLGHLTQFRLDSTDGASTPSRGQKVSPATKEHRVDPGTGEICHSSSRSLKSPMTSVPDFELCSKSMQNTSSFGQLQQSAEEERDTCGKELSAAEGSVQSETLYEENEVLKQRLAEVEARLAEKDFLYGDDPGIRRRSNAFSGKDSKSIPKLSRNRSRSMRSGTTVFKIKIPRYFLRGNGLSAYHVYEVKIRLGKEDWVLYKRFNDFRQFHAKMRAMYPELSQLSLPSSKFFGFRKTEFVEQRRQQLEHYLQSFLAITTSLARCPLSETDGRKLTKDVLEKFCDFFIPTPILSGTVS